MGPIGVDTESKIITHCFYESVSVIIQLCSTLDTYHPFCDKGAERNKKRSNAN